MKSLLALFLLAGSLAHAQGHLLRTSAKVFNFSYQGVANSDRLCESIGLESWGVDDAFPISAAGYSEIYPTPQGRFLAKGGCVRQGTVPMPKLVTPVVFRFNSDSTVDKTFKPIVVMPYINPDSNCRARAIARNPSGDFFWLTECTNARGNTQLPNEVSIYKFSAEGDLDQMFGTAGKLPAPGNQLPISIGHFNNLDVLSDGTLVLTLCYGTGEHCTLYNLNSDRGNVLAQQDIVNGLQKINGETRPLIEPLHFYEKGILKEFIVPVCKDSAYAHCYPYTIPGVSFGVNGFQDFLKRKPILLPQVLGRTGLDLRGLIFQDSVLFQVPDFALGGADVLKFVKFDLQGKKFVHNLQGDEKIKLRVLNAFNPEISFNPPTQGPVDDIAQDLELGLRFSPKFTASVPTNRIRCFQSVSWRERIAITCHESDANDLPLYAVLVLLKSDLSIDTSYADSGYLRVPVASHRYAIYPSSEYVTFTEYNSGSSNGPSNTIRTMFFR